MTELQTIIITHCVHVTSWDDPTITIDVIRILGKKTAVNVAETIVSTHNQSNVA